MLPACTVFVAAGTQPNTVLAREDAAALPARRQVFPRLRRERRRRSQPAYVAGQARARRRADDARSPDGRFVSYFGDLHPSYFGNVVKALGSTKQGHPGGLARAGAAAAGERRRRRGVLRAARSRAARDRARGQAADADDRRAGRQGAGGGAPVPPGAVLPAAELRGAGAGRRRHAAADGGPRAHRRVGRSRSAASCRRSCWRWAARRTCARCSRPASPSC